MRAWLAALWGALARGAAGRAASWLWTVLTCCGCWRRGPTLAGVLRAHPPGPQQTRAFARLVRGDARVTPAALAGLFGGDARGSLEHAPSAAETAALLQARWGAAAAPGDAPALASCVARVRTLTAARARCEALRATPFDARNAAHEALLAACWPALRPGLPPLTARISKEWQALGFQGADPGTDFRSAGELGLRALHHFAMCYGRHGADIIDHTSLPDTGYPLALALLHTTTLAMALLASGHLDGCLALSGGGDAAVAAAPPAATGGGRHEDVDGDAGVTALLDVAGRLLLLLDGAWCDAQPRSVMEFERVFCAFAAATRAALEAGDGRLPEPRRLQRARSASWSSKTAVHEPCTSRARQSPP